MQDSNNIKHVIRKKTLFASIRQTIKKREELQSSIQKLKESCKDKIIGPLTLIFHYDTPVDGFDAEIGYPVSENIDIDPISSRLLRRNEFLSSVHIGNSEDIGDAYQRVYSLV